MSERPVSRILIATILFSLALAACKRSEADVDEEQPWVATGKEAPYSLEMPGHWQPEDAEALNPHADFAASIEGTFFLIVIPQLLPTFPVPDSNSVRKASLEMLEERLDDFVIERQGAVKLHTQDGVAVFFKGSVQGESIQYIATYATHKDWGYQVIAWGPAEHERHLIEQVDAVLTGWTFLDPQKVISEGATSE